MVKKNIQKFEIRPKQEWDFTDSKVFFKIINNSKTIKKIKIEIK